MTRHRLALLALFAVHCGSPADDLESTFEAATAHDVAKLADLAASEIREVRFEALRSLVRDPSADAARAVTDLLARVGVDERREILVTLLETGRRDATTDALLATLCRDSDSGNRAAAFIGVGRLASLPPAFLDTLVAGLDDPDAGAALGAFSGLRDQGWNAAHALAEALANARLVNAERARILLTQLTGHPLSEPTAWRTWLESTEAAMVRVRAEGQWNATGAEEITRALDDDDPAARRAALLALIEVAPIPEGLALLGAPNAKYPDERARATPVLKPPPAPVPVGRHRETHRGRGGAGPLGAAPAPAMARDRGRGGGRGARVGPRRARRLLVPGVRARHARHMRARSPRAMKAQRSGAASLRLLANVMS